MRAADENHLATMPARALDKGQLMLYSSITMMVSGAHKLVDTLNEILAASEES